jgi:hypothetical protein
VTTRRRILVAVSVLLVATTVAPHARADPDWTPLVAVVMLMYAVPTAASWIVYLWMLRGRATIAKALLGVMTCLGGIWGTVTLILVFGEQGRVHPAAKVILGLLLVVQFVRLGIAVMTRATGDRNKETVRRWWRYL